MKFSLDWKILEKLIAIPTLSQDHQACLSALELLKKKLEANEVPTKIDTNNDFPFLVAGNYEKAHTLFLSHIDVVEGSKDQFKLQKSGNKIFGRGVLDMKGPLMVALSAFVSLWKNNKRNFLFAVTSDEEIGGFNGSCFLEKNILKRIKNGFILDSTAKEKLVLIQKAPFHIKITHQGKSAHGSKPWDGVNSAEKISSCAIEIAKKIYRNDPLETSATITQIHSGTSTNVIPENAFATLDIRIKDKKEINRIIKIISTISRRENCQWEKIDEPLFVKISSSDPFIKKWEETSRKLLGHVSQATTEPTASDARFLVKKKRPFIITSVEGEGAHSGNEWANIDSLENLGKMILAFCSS